MNKCVIGFLIGFTITLTVISVLVNMCTAPCNNCGKLQLNTSIYCTNCGYQLRNINK